MNLKSEAKIRNLTDKQQQVYDQIVNLTETYPGILPTASQLAKIFNTSLQNINNILFKLEAKGFIKRERGIKILKK